MKPKRSRRRSSATWLPRRIVYLVEKLPEPARALIDRSLAAGNSFERIQTELQQLGHRISQKALRNYWRKRWQGEHESLRWIHIQSEALATALRHTGESHEAVLARKLLFSVLLQRLEKAIERHDFAQLLRESREFTKATRHLPSDSPTADSALSPEQIGRRVREIYGWPQEELEPEAPGQDKPPDSSA